MVMACGPHKAMFSDFFKTESTLILLLHRNPTPNIWPKDEVSYYLNASCMGKCAREPLSWIIGSTLQFRMKRATDTKHTTTGALSRDAFSLSEASKCVTNTLTCNDCDRISMDSKSHATQLSKSACSCAHTHTHIKTDAHTHTHVQFCIDVLLLLSFSTRST